jgi:hypothetical protein
MPRRNQGPKLRWLDKRKSFYVVWTERGRSRECSTGSADREQAEIFFADWMQRRGRRAGPSDPAAILITDVLSVYAEQRGPKVAAPARIGYAVLALIDFFEGNSVADVTPQTCARYVKKRGRSAGTARRELGVLRAAINFAFQRPDYSPGGCRFAR